MLFSEQCTLCGICAKVCPNGVHELDAAGHKLHKEKCTLCGACDEVCPSFAVEISGERMNASQVTERLMRDKAYYEASGGGITLSGGEPLAQFDFTREILLLAKDAGLHTCVDTSGWGGRAAELVELVDLFLWDIKETDAQQHIYATGVELEPLMSSMRDISAAGGKIALRCPIIPGLNDREAHMRDIAVIADGIQGVVSIELISYHRLGMAKAEAIGHAQEEFSLLTSEDRAELMEKLIRCTGIPARWI